MIWEKSLRSNLLMISNPTPWANIVRISRDQLPWRRFALSECFSLQLRRRRRRRRRCKEMPHVFLAAAGV